jgi:hypothetical protein
MIGSRIRGQRKSPSASRQHGASSHLHPHSEVRRRSKLLQKRLMRAREQLGDTGERRRASCRLKAATSERNRDSVPQPMVSPEP